MRKVTEKMANALKDMRITSSGNTEIRRVNTHDIGLYLHSNPIAAYNGKELKVMDAGWRTNTTKERLNGILQVFGIEGAIFQYNGEWLYHDRKTLTNTAWKGTKVFSL